MTTTLVIGFTTRIQESTGFQMLRYRWCGEDGSILEFELVPGGIWGAGDAEFVANDLEYLAEAIRHKNREHRIKRKKGRKP